jgi:A/G-specific adenine glycosylase
VSAATLSAVDRTGLQECPDGAIGPEFAERLLTWFDQHGRHDLPWQHPRTPYRVWLAEIMLQQTQVQTVIPYYLRFLEHFPSLPILAAAELDAVMALWSGLGYYSRARNLHRAAQICVAEHGATLPVDPLALQALPGIGRSTAGAILAQAHGARLPILDGNVRRVLARYRAVAGDPAATSTLARLWSLAQSALPHTRLADYTQAQMDLGASICTRAKPRCVECPLSEDCLALRERRVAQFPQARARRIRPLRRSAQLLVQDGQGRLLLRRRPPVGIWAGLWSLIDGDDQGAALRSLAALGLEPISVEPMTAFRHEFTHYSLDIEVLRVSTINTGIADSDLRWLSHAEALSLGLPQPLRRLLGDPDRSDSNQTLTGIDP